MSQPVITATGILFKADGSSVEFRQMSGWQSMAEVIGAEYVERVRVAGSSGLSMAVDESGMILRRPVNPRASTLYGYRTHGHQIYGDAVVMAEGPTEDGIDWLVTDEDTLMAMLRDHLILLSP